MLCLFASGAQRNERKETKFSISRSHLGFRPNHLVPENMFLASCTVLFYCNVQPARLYAGGTRLIFFRLPLVFFSPVVLQSRLRIACPGHCSTQRETPLPYKYHTVPKLSFQPIYLE